MTRRSKRVVEAEPDPYSRVGKVVTVDRIEHPELCRHWYGEAYCTGRAVGEHGRCSVHSLAAPVDRPVATPAAPKKPVKKRRRVVATSRLVSR